MATVMASISSKPGGGCPHLVMTTRSNNCILMTARRTLAPFRAAGQTVFKWHRYKHSFQCHNNASAVGTREASSNGIPSTSLPPSPEERADLSTGSSDTLQQSQVQPRFDDSYLWSLIWQQKHHLLIAASSVLLCSASNLAAPVITGRLVELLVNQRPMQEYVRLLAVLCLGYCIEPLLTRVYNENLVGAGEKVLALLRLELFRSLLVQKLSFFDQHSATELTGLISVELDTLRSFVFNNASRDRGPRALLEAVGAIIVLFSLSWRLAPVCSIVIVMTSLAAVLYRRHTRDIEQRQARALQRMTGVAQQALDNIRTVRSFAGEGLEQERFQAQVVASYHAGCAFASAKAWFEAANRAAIHASLLALYAWGGWLVSRGLMPLRVMVSGIGFTFSLMFATQGVANCVGVMWRAAGALGRVRAMVQRSDPDRSMCSSLPPRVSWEATLEGRAAAHGTLGEQAGNAAVLAARSGSLELRDVHFAYPGRPEVAVLQGLNLTLRRGQITALVGRSGSGKSTIASLLSRFYEPQEGLVTLDGIPQHSFTQREWSRAVAMVGQEPVLFSGSIADNISYGRYGRASQEEIEAAARAANAHDFIMDLPQGYGTAVGERGVLLSGGQRQRLALARCLLKDSPIIILDEATSALDTVSEQLVQGAIQRLVRGRTVLVIAHRLSTIQSADQIVVLKDQRIVEAGTHEELASLRGSHYSELMKAQDLILAST